MTTTTTQDDLPLGIVLVTGGCGFLGYHLVAQLLADPACGPVYVLDPAAPSAHNNAHPGATYLRASVTDPPAALAAVLDAVRPRVVFHAASPNATYSPRAAFHAANVRGTRTLLALLAARARDQHSGDDDDDDDDDNKNAPPLPPRALVYTSSLDVYADPPHRRVAEDHPLLPERPRFWAGVSEYDRTKAVAHRLVLAANDPAGLRTAVIVPAHIWGLRDSQALSLFFDMFADPRRPVWQIGPGTNVVSRVEAGNCAAAHILAAKRLVADKPASSDKDHLRVDGEAFNVTDGADINFWADVRAWCALIRTDLDGRRQQQQQQQQKIHVIPAWAMGVVVAVAGWLYLVLTLGHVDPPPALGRNSLSWCTEDHTLDDSKARRRLGYKPRDVDENRLQAEAVKWERERRRRRMAAGQKDD